MIAMFKETSRYDRTKMGMWQTLRALEREILNPQCTFALVPDRLPVWETVSKLVGLFP